jgi:hypothetical protein
MAKRFSDSEKWKKPFLRSLQAPYKLFWLYILDDCDHAGIWHVDIEIAEIKIGEKIDKQTAINQFNGKINVIQNGEKWFIKDFIEFQYGTLNPLNRVHESVIKILKKENLINENMELISPLQGAKDKDKDKGKDKEKDKNKDKGVKILFKDSEYYDINVLSEALSKSKPPYTEAHVGYYYEAMELWSKQGNKKLDWLATCQNWILRDIADNKFKDKNFKPQQNGKQSTPKTNYPDNSTPYGDI